jgi:predicted oxidoreductase
MDPHEVAGAFCVLKDAGKVREFGVSNFRPSQLAALQKASPFPLIVNQVEINLGRPDCFEDGTLDQCLTKNIIPLAWSPLFGGQLADGAKRLLKSQEGKDLTGVLAELDAIANARGASRSVIALAWLLKHPSKIVPIIGSTDPARIREAVKADSLDLSREEWYRLFVAARGERLP